MLILYRKNKQSEMEKEDGVDENKQSGMSNRKRVKIFKHDGIVKEEDRGAGCNRGETLTKLTIGIII